MTNSEERLTPSQLNASLTFARGAVQASLSRAAVDWMVNTIDLSKTFEQLDRQVVGVDEVLIPSLQVSDSLNMPGRFTGDCVKNGKMTGFITRLQLEGTPAQTQMWNDHLRNRDRCLASTCQKVSELALAVSSSAGGDLPKITSKYMGSRVQGRAG
ncbi:hypothetical protein COOONC_01037 [Cooperia oncophora]